jgi:hypothetical protein
VKVEVLPLNIEYELMLQDFSAHSNYCELALRELGYPDVFSHTGHATQINLHGRQVFPLVTGTFGAVDFLHSGDNILIIIPLPYSGLQCNPQFWAKPPTILPKRKSTNSTKHLKTQVTNQIAPANMEYGILLGSSAKSLV